MPQETYELLWTTYNNQYHLLLFDDAIAKQGRTGTWNNYDPTFSFRTKSSKTGLLDLAPQSLFFNTAFFILGRAPS